MSESVGVTCGVPQILRFLPCIRLFLRMPFGMGNAACHSRANSTHFFKIVIETIFWLPYGLMFIPKYIKLSYSSLNRIETLLIVLKPGRIT